ncbi:MAG: hypothetical protein K0Q79_469 [Flavipsychrobacter sp.]|jgi:hypothetical protein|nr:hypothetical protein [Flavipsychrobacter sp.]
MKLQKKIFIFITLAILSVIVFICLPENAHLIPTYDEHIFYPFQSLRGRLFSSAPLSFGDIIYVAMGFSLLVTILKWIFWLFSVTECGEKLAVSFVSTLNTALFLYLFFIIGWGANYYKPSLAKNWGLVQTDSALQQLSKGEFKQMVIADLTAFDTFLINRINEYAPHYRSSSFKKINRRAVDYYRQYTDSKVKDYGLGIKPTLFSYFMERLGVEGYYNPFTGEGQINKNMPAFILPFLISHEIAHQAGIAAEGDANLMAYALCTATDDSSFRYSAYLEIWLYTNRRLYYRDSALALSFEKQLNKLTLAHIDTIEEINKKSDNEYARYSSELFDSYLKMNDQKEGIRTYGNVSATAWRLEQRRILDKNMLIIIP